MLFVCDSALTLSVGWLEGHLAYKKTLWTCATLAPKVVF